jgi:hypothetical protein
MINDEMIKVEMMNELNKEIGRLKSIAGEKEKLPAMARIVISACALLAKADGKTTTDELFNMKKTIFKRFCINDNIVNQYIPTLFIGVNPLSLKNDIEKYKIDKNFLKNVYYELMDSIGLGNLTPEESEVFAELTRIFDLPVIT